MAKQILMLVRPERFAMSAGMRGLAAAAVLTLVAPAPSVAERSREHAATISTSAAKPEMPALRHQLCHPAL